MFYLVTPVNTVGHSCIKSVNAHYTNSYCNKSYLVVTEESHSSTIYFNSDENLKAFYTAFSYWLVNPTDNLILDEENSFKLVKKNYFMQDRLNFLVSFLPNGLESNKY